MVKFSANWKKQKAKISRFHSHIANIRRDYLHKTTTTISKNHAMIVIEDLKVSNMSKSAAGTVDQPGRNVAAKSGLNRAILDQAGQKCAASSNISRHGAAVMYWRLIRRTPVRNAHVVGIHRKITAGRRRALSVPRAAIRQTPM